jgi:cell division inhibitor SulA/protein ImuA
MPERPHEQLTADVDNLPGVWRGSGSRQVAGKQAIPTGWEALDAVLPGQGWSFGYLTEILSDRHGSGELALIMPALTALSDRGVWLTWIAPPSLPNPPALAAAGLDLSRLLLIQPRCKSDVLWAAEQALRQARQSPVLIWMDACSGKALRRLQLAAAAGESLGVIVRPMRYAQTPSPAALRLTVSRQDAELCVNILKVRGARPIRNLYLPDERSLTFV